MPAPNKCYTNLPASVRIIVDSADASKDRFVTIDRAQQLALRGLIVPDITNNCWCTVNGQPLPLKDSEKQEVAGA